MRVATASNTLNVFNTGGLLKVAKIQLAALQVQIPYWLWLRFIHWQISRTKDRQTVGVHRALEAEAQQTGLLLVVCHDVDTFSR